MRIKNINEQLHTQPQFRLKPAYAAVLLAFTAQTVQANPTDATVVSGQASFAATANTLTVTNTPGTIIHWQGFSIGANEITRFAQQSASSAVLNRVVSNNPSSILGTLQSNGRVFLINPNGIVFGAGSTVDVAGLVASTLNLSNADFLVGRYSFTQVPGAQNISNAGNISSHDGGQIYLIAPDVENTGVITAPNGEILLAAGHSVDLVNTDSPNLIVNITAPAGDATNVGQLIAQSGSLGLFGTVVRNSGAVSADSATLQGGKIVFKASQRAEIGGAVSANGASGGSIDISAAPSPDPDAPGVVIHTGSIAANGIAGAGGSVSIGADSILSTAAINADGTTAGGLINVQATNRALSTAAAQYSVSSSQGQGGDMLVSANVSNYTSGLYSATGMTGGNLTLAGNEIKLAGAQLDASGTDGGGTIHVGGLMHGAAGFAAQGIALVNATNVLVNSAATLNANAMQTGNGGEVVLWSDQAMRFTGNISAQGGVLGGNGGMAEVSGLTSLGYGGLTDLSAVNGLNGTLLLDPRNISIVAGSGGSSGVPYQEILDPTPGAGEGFGGLQTLELVGSGNIVIASPLDNLNSATSGAVYLYNSTGTLLSALVGSAAGDKVGGVTYNGLDSGGISELGNGNVIVASNNWSGTLGAVTWMNGTTGALSDGSIGGAVATANSLVGSLAGDKVGTFTIGIYDMSGIHVLSNGNVAIASNNWGGTIGAVSWMDGANGGLSDGSTGGPISSSNSLVGSTAGDRVGSNITLLANSNLVAGSPNWSNGAVTNAGAATWMSGSTGLLSDGSSTGGIVSALNSLVGSTTGDMVGNNIIALSASNNVFVVTANWNNAGTAANAGAVTWMNGANGKLADLASGGAISAANSLVGSLAGDKIGTNTFTNFGTYDWTGLTLLDNGNLLIGSNNWNGTRGAATWMSGANGLLSDGSAGGVVSISNSLLGSTGGDRVGSERALLPSNNVVISSSEWNGTRGAMTWMSGADGKLSDGSTGGAVSVANSLLGSTAGDKVGTSTYSWGADYNAYTLLGNGNLVIASNNWSGTFGAVTWMNGATGALSDGLTGGVVSAANSLLGSAVGDRVGSNYGGIAINMLLNGNVVVISDRWGSGGVAANARGAVTWMDGTTGKLSDLTNGGVISVANSLIGNAAGDRIGSSGITPIFDFLLLSFNYLVNSPEWGSGGGAGAGLGAVTWMNGATGKLSTSATGDVVSGQNSLVGSTAGDRAGLGNGTVQLIDGNVLVHSIYWSNTAGAMTWMNGATGELSNSTGVAPVFGGAISAANSLLGTTVGDNLGSGGVTQLFNGKLVIASPYWSVVGTATYEGAVTWMDGATGKLSDASTGGAITATNSLIGSSANDRVGADGVTLATDYLTFWNYVVRSSGWNSNAGAITWVDGATGKTSDGLGTISSSNSLVGSTAGDYVGLSSFSGDLVLGNGNAVFASSSWNGGMGAVTWINGKTGKLSDNSPGGVVSSANSLVGTTATLLVTPFTTGDQIGSGGLAEITDHATFWNYAVMSPSWTNGGTAEGSGAVTLGNGVTGTVGLVSSSNSLVGGALGDKVGSGGITLISDDMTFWNFVVSSPDWGSAGVMYSGFGAVTWMNGKTGFLTTGALGGVIDATNSLVGSSLSDTVGSLNYYSSGITTLSNGNVLVRSPQWGGQFSALTWMNGATGALAGGATGGVVSASNSLVGSTIYDDLGSGAVGLTELVNGNWVITSPNWGGGGSVGKGAATWMNSSTGRLADGSFGGVVSASNSLVGSGAGDVVGGDYFCDCSSPPGGITALSDGNYVVNSPDWSSGTGAVTWGNGMAGLVGLVSASNSVFGVVSNINEMASQPGTVLVGSGTANGGAGGVYLLGAGAVSGPLFADSPGADGTIGADLIASTLSAGTNIVLQANNDITQSAAAAINATGAGNLTLQAGRSVILNDGVFIGGALSITANDAGANPAYRSAGAALIETSGLAAASITLTNTGGDIMLGGNISKAGIAAGVLNVQAANNILLKGTVTIASPSGILDVNLFSNSDGAGGGGIYLDAGSSINSNGGNITIGGMPSVGRAIGNGTVTGGVTFDSGIHVLGDITAGAGNVTMRGEGANNNFADGITFAGGTLSSNGIVTIDGIAHGYSTAVSLPNLFAAGVDFLNAGTRLTTQTGTVTVTGLNTAPNADPSFYRADGIMVETGTIVETTGAGTLTFNGTANSLNTSWGVGVFGGTIRTTAAGGGAIMLNGTNAGNADGGVVLMGGQVLSSGGDIFIEGSSAGGDSIGIASGSTIGGANAGNITLVADEKFVNADAGNPITTAGRWLIYSPSSGATTLGGITADFKRYNCTYANGCLTAGTTIPATGNGLLYAVAPTLSIAANAASKVYGAADPAYTHVVAAGLIDGDLANTPDVLAGSLGRTAATGETVAGGPYPIDQGTLTSPMGYGISYTSANLTITPATLTVTANNAAKIFDAVAYSGGNGVTYTGFVNSETFAVLGGALAYGGTSQGAVNAGSYVITPGGFISGNYTIGYVDGILTIDPATLTLLSVTANDASKTYGTALTFNGSEFTPVGLLGGDTISGVTLASAGAVDTANAGTYAITPSNAVFSVGSASNYTLSYVDGQLTVTARPINVTANAIGKVYGDTDPALTYTVGGLGLTTWDTNATAFTGALARVAGENVAASPYAISQGTLTASNYTITFAGNVFSITPAPLSVYAFPTNKIISTPDPLLTYMVSGLKLDDTAAETLNSGSLARDAGEAVGNYQINQGSLALASSNYTMNYFPASFTILAPTVVDEIANAILLLGTPETGSAQSTSASEEEEKRKAEEAAAAAGTPASGDTATPPLPVCPGA